MRWWLIGLFGLITACTPLSVSTPTLAPTPWSPYQIGLPTHTTILALAVSPRNPNTVFAGAYDTTGVYVSTDQARSWRAISAGLNHASVLSLQFIGDTLFAGTTAGLYRLRDTQWEQVDPVVAVAVNAIMLRADGTAYIATNGSGVFKSADAGESWTRLAGLDSEMILSVAALDAQTLIAGTSGHGAFVTRDGGRTWHALGLFAGEYVSSIVMDPRDGKTIYLSTHSGLFRSRDGGVTWQRLLGGIETEIDYALLFTPERIYAATGNRGVFVSEDDGGSWQNDSAGLPGGVAMLAIAQLDAQTILVGAQNGIYLTQNAGKRWQPVNDGLGVPQIHALALNPQSEALFAATEDGIYRAQSDGQFEPVGGDAPHEPTLSIAITSSNPQVIYAGTYRRGIFVSRDGGASWHPAGDMFQGRLSVPGLATDPRNDRNVFARVLFERIYKSSDGGETWHAVWTGMRDGDQVQTINPAPSDPTQMYAGTADGLYFSQNGGESWQGAGLGGLSVFAIWIDPGDPRSLLAGATDGLYRRADSDTPWVPSGLAGITVTDIIRNANMTLFVGSKYHGVWVSRDNARTWTRLGTGLDDASVIALSADNARGVLYAATTRGLFKINYS